MTDRSELERRLVRAADEIEGLRVAAHEYEESGDSAMAAYERRQADRLERILNDGGDHGD